jgi:hypothetical protein
MSIRFLIDHDRERDIVIVNVKMSNGEEIEMERRTEDVRLIESRKSARLVDQDYSEYPSSNCMVYFCPNIKLSSAE